MATSAPASRAAPNTTFWNRSSAMATEHEQAQGLQVEVLVGARRPVHLGGAAGQLGRIEHDEVVALTPFPPLAQVGERIGHDLLDASPRRDDVASERLRRQRQGGGG